jgi:hypothetical protein
MKAEWCLLGKKWGGGDNYIDGVINAIKASYIPVMNTSGQPPLIHYFMQLVCINKKCNDIF